MSCRLFRRDRLDRSSLRTQRAPELESRVRRLVARAALGVKNGCVLEQFRRSFEPTAGAQGSRAQRRRPHPSRQPLELSDGRGRLLALVELEPGADEQLEAGDALEPIRVAYPAQESLGGFARARSVSDVERQRTPDEQRSRMTLGLPEERLRLLCVSLAPPQLGQADDAVGHLARHAAEVAAGGDEHRLRLPPVAAPHQQVGVVGSAGREHLDVVVPL